MKKTNLKCKKQNLTSTKGITLIALVITIIVMLILVAVTINMAVNGGLFGYAGNATKETKDAINNESELASGGVNIDGVYYDSIDEYINRPEVKFRIVKGTFPSGAEHIEYEVTDEVLTFNCKKEDTWASFIGDNTIDLDGFVANGRELINGYYICRQVFPPELQEVLGMEETLIVVDEELKSIGMTGTAEYLQLLQKLCNGEITWEEYGALEENVKDLMISSPDKIETGDYEYAVIFIDINGIM